MNRIAVISTAGGSGRTTLAAVLAVLLARRRRPVVALDLDPQNLLGTYLGLDTFAETGLGSALANGDDAWGTPSWRNADGVLFAPYGELHAQARIAAEERLARQPNWVADAIAKIDLPATGVVIMDTPRYPSLQAEQAVSSADLVLCVSPPEPAACATLARRLSTLALAQAEIRIVVNRLNPARDMQRDALAMLRVAVGEAHTLMHRIHLDAAMPEAFARGGWHFDDAPHSQASHDLQGIANWLDAWLDERRAQRAIEARVQR